ncbi:Minor teichoic acid biosynthesis protein GgaA [Bacillus sp. ZZV12-4809]|nr:Minor teichoic acid biosynthesis protein GgaA [Bacillus sp. ZZV12-4809]
MKFSIIIPVYNAEKYLAESIDSIIHQSNDFIQSTEIILVDDGSTDQSGEICKSYSKQFPLNVKYIYCENAGPGNARNVGLDAVSMNSRYIGFLDADDYFSENTLEKVDEFFNKYQSTQLAVIPLFHFERIDTPHRLNYRFDRGSRVIDINEDYTAIHFHIGGCFFRAEHFTSGDKIRFQRDIHFWEDALLINTFLLNHKEYGVVSGPKYYYRKRAQENSLVNSAWYQKSRYTDMIRLCYLPLINLSNKLYGNVIPYIHFLIIYHLRLYLFPKNNEIIYNVLSEQEQDEFFKKFVRLLQYIDDKYIKEQDMPFYYKNYLLNLKQNGWPYKNVPIDIKKLKVTLTDFKFRGSHWLLEGHLKNKNYMLQPEDRIFIKIRNKTIYLQKEELPAKHRKIWGTVVRDYRHAGFKTYIPIFYYKFQFGLQTKENTYYLNKVNLFGLFKLKNKD